MRYSASIRIIGAISCAFHTSGHTPPWYRRNYRDYKRLTKLIKESVSQNWTRKKGNINAPDSRRFIAKVSTRVKLRTNSSSKTCRESGDLNYLVCQVAKLDSGARGLSQLLLLLRHSSACPSGSVILLSGFPPVQKFILYPPTHFVRTPKHPNFSVSNRAAIEAQ